MKGYPCELCHPGVYGPWRFSDGLPTWCSRHWYEAIKKVVEGDETGE